MKRLFALLALCLPLYLFAQGFGSFSHDQPFFASSSSGASPWTPTNLVGITGWYIADEVYTNASPEYPVLPDRSGNGYDMTNRAAAGLWPTLQATNLNGHNTYKFDGSNDHIKNMNLFTANDTEIWMVHRLNALLGTSQFTYGSSNTSGASEFVYSTSSADKLTIRSSTTANIVSTSVKFPTNKWMVVTCAHLTAGFIRTNNVLASNEANMGNGQSGFTLGTRGGLDCCWAGFEIAELVILNTAQTEGARSNLFNYWTNKYAISP